MKNIVKVTLLVVVVGFAAYHLNQNAVTKPGDQKTYVAKYKQLMRDSKLDTMNQAQLEALKNELQEIRNNVPGMSADIKVSGDAFMAKLEAKMSPEAIIRAEIKKIEDAGEVVDKLTIAAGNPEKANFDTAKNDNVNLMVAQYNIAEAALAAAIAAATRADKDVQVGVAKAATVEALRLQGLVQSAYDAAKAAGTAAERVAATKAEGLALLAEARAAITAAQNGLIGKQAGADLTRVTGEVAAANALIAPAEALLNAIAADSVNETAANAAKADALAAKTAAVAAQNAAGLLPPIGGGGGGDRALKMEQLKTFVFDTFAAIPNGAGIETLVWDAVELVINANGDNAALVTAVTGVRDGEGMDDSDIPALALTNFVTALETEKTRLGL